MNEDMAWYINQTRKCGYTTWSSIIGLLVWIYDLPLKTSMSFLGLNIFPGNIFLMKPWPILRVNSSLLTSHLSLRPKTIYVNNELYRANPVKFWLFWRDDVIWNDNHLPMVVFWNMIIAKLFSINLWYEQEVKFSRAVSHCLLPLIPPIQFNPK